MADRLADAFRSEIPCDGPTAARLADLARAYLARLGGSRDDSDEDILLRFRDPRTFGAFAEIVSDDVQATPPVREAVLEHVFDLLPLPRSEGDVIEVEARAPPRLLALANRVAESGGLTVLHVMHLVFAVFLDRSLLVNVPRPVRTALCRAILGQTDASETLRVLYACLHLATVPGPEAAAEFRHILKSKRNPVGLRRTLATLAASEDGGQAALARMAQREGLLPADLTDVQAPGIVANIPRMPERLAAPGRRFAEHDSRR